jgi:hypothetical protein
MDPCANRAVRPVSASWVPNDFEIEATSRRGVATGRGYPSKA